MQSRLPRSGDVVFWRRIAGAEVEDTDFVGGAGGMGGRVDEGSRSVGGGDGGESGYEGEGEAEGGGFMGGLEGVGEVQLVEDVAFGGLD